MTTAVHWVIGGGGLLGSAVRRNLRERGDELISVPRVRWSTPEASPDLGAGLAATVASAAGGRWVVYWCAGTGTTASTASEFRIDADVFLQFIADLKALNPTAQSRGTVFFASSAGALYGGSVGAPFTEQSATATLGDYGQAKQAAELALEELTATSNLRVVVGRITNIYGPGQSLQKQQGLISRLCVSDLTKVPLSIFVPADTLRDYVFVDDCAALVTAITDRMMTESSSYCVKILSSGRSIGVGALISEFGKVTHRRPSIVWGQSMQAQLQSSDLRVESVVWTDLDTRPMVTLIDGIAQTLEHTRRLLAATGSQRF